jgi:CheY-like chemotaxis protein
MRLKVIKRPTGTVDDIPLDRFQIGEVYELGTEIACVFLAEGWAEVDPAPAAPAETAKPLVLVVEDEPQVRRLTELILTSHGYRVIVAAQGKEALQRIRERCPDLILLDLNMPVMDGWHFRAEQRYLTDRKLAAVPVVLMTADDEPASHADALFAVGVIQKPFDPDDLLDAVSAAIGIQTQPDGLGSMRPWRRPRKIQNPR